MNCSYLEIEKAEMLSLISPYHVTCLFLLAGQLAQVYDVDQRSLKYQWKFPHPIEHWVWLDSDTLAVVTEEEIFHWAMKREY